MNPAKQPAQDRVIREYLTALPKESALAAELVRTRDLLERQAGLRQRAKGAR